MRCPDYKLTIKSYLPNHDHLCPVCDKEAYKFYQVYMDGSDAGNERYACSSDHYHLILFREGQSV